ncbi:MAG TPA: 5-methyltetrahydropteroyltriglutamate--homocysteine S-methyltransferase [Stellaceae bacterium]
MQPPYRADHVGSLIRPRSLIQARQDRKRDLIDAAALRAIEDQAIRDSVLAQQRVGLKAITDGEFRRDSWHWDFYREIGGIEELDQLVAKPLSTQGSFQFTASALRAKERLTLNHTIFGDDFAFLKGATTGTAKLTIPAPSVLHRRGGPRLVDPAIYPDIAEFWSDLAAVYAAEIAALGRLGCRYLQLDDTSFAALCDPVLRAQMISIGSDGDTIHLTYIRAINEALRGRPAGMAVTLHTCRGNFRGVGFASGGYDFLAESLFGELAVDGFFLEYDDARSGGFEPLRFLPKGKKAVLGLVSTKTGAMESPDAIKRRIDHAARFAPLDQLCLSPQCGFASVAAGEAVADAEQFAKLRLVVETARAVWGDA